MQILGLCFAGTITSNAAEMSSFVSQALGLPRTSEDGADFFSLPDGSYLAVAQSEGPEPPRRSIGFKVADLSQAMAELRAAGIQVGEPAQNSSMRYVHFVAPDAQVYELVEFR